MMEGHDRVGVGGEERLCGWTLVRPGEAEGWWDEGVAGVWGGWMGQAGSCWGGGQVCALVGGEDGGMWEWWW